MKVLSLLFLLPLVHSANIFVGPLLGGSHTTALYELAVLLGDAGHNITFVNVYQGGLDKLKPHPNIHRVDMIVWEGEERELMWSMCVAPLMEGKSAESMNVFSDSCVSIWGTVFTRANEVYTGTAVREDLFSQTKFDAILGESVQATGLSILGTLTNTPVIDFVPSLSMFGAIIHNNLPTLLSSQPHFFYEANYNQPPTFMERFRSNFNFIKFLPAIQNRAKMSQPFLEQFGFTDPAQVGVSVKLFLTNDHPAFTFPFMRKLLELPWLPQKDLLRSGKLAMFVSHCGNNGRMEAIYYNVPVLCVPQFADQLMNSKFINYKSFGDILLREEVKEKGKEVVESMIENLDEYRANMKYASDIVDNEPGNVKERLLFYVDHVAKFGNVDFLVNNIVKQQGFVEFYNLDILLLLLVGGLFVLGIGLFVAIKVCKLLLGKVTRKFKDE